MGKTVKAMKYEIETNNWDCLMAKAFRNEMARKWDESLQMANAQNIDKSDFDVYWEEALDNLADFQLQVIRQYRERWDRKSMYGTWD